MNVDKEIQKIIEFKNSILPLRDKKSESALNLIIQQVQANYKNGTYDFSKFKAVNKKQDNKIRHTKTYDSFSCEEVLCIYLKRVLDRRFHIKYPNRNEYVHSLFDIISALHTMNDYSIFRFDFEDFFNTVSSEYVLKKYISQSSLERHEITLLENFAHQTKFAYAGLNTSNIICEIIAKQFDDLLKLKFKNYGLIFYRRYIDDGILIFNRRVGNDMCLTIINEAIREVFFDSNITGVKKCKTRLNIAKTKYISAYDLALVNGRDNFDYLGYEFVLVPKYNQNRIKTEFQYGLTQKKIDKYSGKINNLVREYMADKNVELLRHKLKAFASRVVYQIPKYKKLIWKTKGFIANYQELRYRRGLLTNDTENFLKNAIIDAFVNNGISLPYFLKSSQKESIYNLYNNLLSYRTLLFVESIGIAKQSLSKMCVQIGISSSSQDYNDFVREYLIKVKVGH